MKKIQISRSSLSLIAMMFLSIITQVLSIGKSSIVAARFGLSMEMDAFNFANSIISFLFGIIAGGIPTIIIPEYVKNEDTKNVNRFLTLVYATLMFVIIIVILFRFNIVSTLTNRNDIFVNITCNVLLILLFAQYLLSITNITSAFFQCNGYFNVPKIIALFSQLIVVVLLLINKSLSIYQYTAIISIGIIVNFLLDICISKKLGWKFKLDFKFEKQGLEKYFKMFFPMLLSTGVYNISLFIDSTIASRFDTGKLTVLSYSNQISGIVNAILIGNLLTYIYPKIIRCVHSNENQEEFWNAVVLFHSIISLIIIEFLLVGKEGIELLFGRGLFDNYAVRSVYIGTAIYLIGMQTNVIRDLLYRYFYANGNTKGPASNSVVVSIFNILFSILLVLFVGFYGVILGTVVSSLFSLLMILLKFSREYCIKVDFKKIIFEMLKNIIIAIVCLCIATFIKNMFEINNLILSIVINGLLIFCLYVILMNIFNKNIIKILKNI